MESNPRPKLGKVRRFWARRLIWKANGQTLGLSLFGKAFTGSPHFGAKWAQNPASLWPNRGWLVSKGS